LDVAVDADHRSGSAGSGSAGRHHHRAAGDNGSSDGVTDGSNNVDFPASSPNVLACGGTTLEFLQTAPSPAKQSGTTAQRAARPEAASALSLSPSRAISHRWQPTTQDRLAAACRTSAGDADPDTGYNILVDGSQEVVGGTSAVAPLWAGLVALLNQQLNKRLGFLNPAIYAWRSQTTASTTSHRWATTDRILRAQAGILAPALARRLEPRWQPCWRLHQQIPPPARANVLTINWQLTCQPAGPLIANPLRFWRARLQPTRLNNGLTR
jgi:hypothetical protein